MFLLSPFSYKIRCEYNFHDYIDGDIGEHWHFFQHKCKRCGMKFFI